LLAGVVGKNPRNLSLRVVILQGRHSGRSPESP
jgi:hypothetical protein